MLCSWYERRKYCGFYVLGTCKCLYSSLSFAQKIHVGIPISILILSFIYICLYENRQKSSTFATKFRSWSWSMNGKQLLISNAKTQLEHRILSSTLGKETMKLVRQHVLDVDNSLVVHLCNTSLRTLTSTNLAYILCFWQHWILRQLQLSL